MFRHCNCESYVIRVDGAEVDTMALLPADEEAANSSDSAVSPWVQFKIPNVAPSEERVEAIYEDLCYIHVPAIRPEVHWADSKFEFKCHLVFRFYLQLFRRLFKIRIAYYFICSCTVDYSKLDCVLFYLQLFHRLFKIRIAHSFICSCSIAHSKFELECYFIFRFVAVS